MSSRSKRVVLGASILAALIVSATATATGPEITRFSFDDHYIDTQTCPGIPIDTLLEGRVTVTVHSSTRVEVHQRLVYRATGNGKSFTEELYRVRKPGDRCLQVLWDNHQHPGPAPGQPARRRRNAHHRLHH